ncbi:hypothetical protein PFICI_03864 [Pestalotiopsis fici W106-1]|uniref:Amino acid transporter transmembrane domain-containing protein n=1 Tax=Pestalotiopsis fici (strain W106-1 / CGMCC3.15140) TaxID=1229662 RepID=W3XIL1_PESFW|nr:uncharacterized protein PFICI_03864 [Pestalotiopsis fici W106-1]ETS85839.1 hypothetical protein PFICI_03864 [Pestalotiopsis fici W106-1]
MDGSIPTPIQTLVLLFTLDAVKSSICAFIIRRANVVQISASGIPPDSYSVTGTESGGILKGLNTIVYAYGDSLLFANLLGEMKNPSDFYRVLLMAVALVYAVYVFFGTFIYSYYGQYTYNPIVQGKPTSILMSRRKIAANAVAVMSSLIIAVLYANIGVKIIYVEVLHKLLGFPALRSQRGRWFWAGSIALYWTFVFLIAAFAPSFSYIISFLGAWIMLSYAFPALMALAYWMQKDIITADNQHISISGTSTSTNYGFQDWKRSFRRRPFFFAANILLFGSAFTLFGCGMYSAIVDALHQEKDGSRRGLTCKGPM